MSKIFLEDLSDGVKEYLMTLGLTEDQIYYLLDLWYNEKIINNENPSNHEKTLVDSINDVVDHVDNMDLSEYQLNTDNNLQTENKQLVDAINEIYQSKDNIKQELVAILALKGLEATSDMDFTELLDKTEDLIAPTFVDAVASDVLEGKTFINSEGELTTGAIVDNGSKTIAPSSSSQSLSAGYYGSITVNGNGNLVASNIREGVTIFGVTGNYWNQKSCSGTVWKNHSITSSGRSTVTVPYPRAPLSKYPSTYYVSFEVSKIDFFTNSGQTEYVTGYASNLYESCSLGGKIYGRDFPDTNGNEIHSGIFYFDEMSRGPSDINVRIDWSYSNDHYGFRMHFYGVYVSCTV